jgi:uncharacterized OsmC-like protein
MGLGPNDVDLEKLRGTDQLIRDNPALSRCVFKARSTWQRGTKVQVSVGEWTAGGTNMAPPPRRFTIMVDEPEILGGVDGAPNPVEVLLSALCGCVTLGTATNAALFDVPLDGIEIEMEGHLDARGMLGHDRSVRNGLDAIHYTITIQSPASEEQVRKCKETIDRKSPVRDTLARGVSITSTFVHKSR